MTVPHVCPNCGAMTPKWTPALRRAVLDEYEADKYLTMREMAARHGVSISFISKIIKQAKREKDTP